MDMDFFRSVGLFSSVMIWTFGVFTLALVAIVFFRKILEIWKDTENDP